MPSEDEHPAVQEAEVAPSKKVFQRPDGHNQIYHSWLKPSLGKENETLLVKKMVSDLPTEVAGKDAEVKKLDNIWHFYTHLFLNCTVHLFFSTADAWKENSHWLISELYSLANSYDCYPWHISNQRAWEMGAWGEEWMQSQKAVTLFLKGVPTAY